MIYLTDDMLTAIKEMALLNRGRLSVQPVTEEAYEAVVKLSKEGGWESWPGKWNTKATSAPASKAAKTTTATPPAAKKEQDEAVVPSKKAARSKPDPSAATKKAKVEEDAPLTPNTDGLRRSSRRRSGI